MSISTTDTIAGSDGATTVLNAEQFKDSVFILIKTRGLPFRKLEKNQDKILAYFEQKQAEIEAKKAAGEEIDLSRVAVVNGTLGKVGKGQKAAVNGVPKILLFSPALDALREHLTATKSAITAPPQYGGLANPSGFLDGLFELAKEQVPAAKAIIAEGRRRLTEEWQDKDGETHPGYLTAFLDDYSAAIYRAEHDAILDGGLGPLFNRGDYPTAEEVESSFDILKRFISLNVPEGLNAEDKAEAMAELRADLKNGADEIINGLREIFIGLINHGKEVLTVQPNEKPKVIKDSLIGNVLQFCETFSLRNTHNDEQLAALVEQAKEVLTGTDPDRLRKYANIREEKRAALEQISQAYDKMIVTQRGRVMDLSED